MTEVARVIRFEKWEGLGNDFVVVDVPVSAMNDDTVRALCDRHRGIGADGILFVDHTEDGRPRMTVRNADGSRPEMCGNGLRCVAAYLATKAAQAPGEMVIATDAGDKHCKLQRVADGLFDIEIEMGRARIGNPIELFANGRFHRFNTVDIGNPHAISFKLYQDAEIDEIGPIIATTPDEGTNVEFCVIHMTPGTPAPRLHVTVWERGVGRTLACGTGACAVGALAVHLAIAREGVPIPVVLPGGTLEITVLGPAPGRRVRMRGPARRVFVGEVSIA